MSRYIRRRRRRLRMPRILLILLLTLCAARLVHEEKAVQPLALAPEQEASAVSVWFPESGTISEMALETYIAHVVSAEMPDNFHLQALCAQAVAARSYLAYRLRDWGGSGCASHPEADVCASHACCQAYAEEAFPAAVQAAQATAGQILLYDARPVNALYHASSGGRTADVESVFSQALPYLRSVESPGEEDYVHFSAESGFTHAELAEILPIDEKAPLSEQLEVLKTDASGRALSIRAGGAIVSGTEFRKLLSLPSARMEFSFEKDRLVVSTTGYGHGVGMSQTGADAMARRGADYTEILAWYYTGCEVSDPP